MLIDASDVQKIADYTEQFRQALYELADVALQPISELAVAAAVHSLYSPMEIVRAAATARALQLTPAEGAAFLADLTAMAEVHGRTFFGKLTMLVSRKGGHHLLMAKAAKPDCDKIDDVRDQHL